MNFLADTKIFRPLNVSTNSECRFIYRPDYGKTPFDDEDPEWMNAMAPYIDAATAGRQMFDCAAIYYGCPEGQGILEFITTLRDE